MDALTPEIKRGIPKSMLGLRFRAEEALHWRQHHHANDIAVHHIESVIDVLEVFLKLDLEASSRRLHTRASKQFIRPRRMLILMRALLTMRMALDAMRDAEISLESYAKSVQAHIDAMAVAHALSESVCSYGPK